MTELNALQKKFDDARQQLSLATSSTSAVSKMEEQLLHLKTCLEEKDRQIDYLQETVAKEVEHSYDILRFYSTIEPLHEIV